MKSFNTMQFSISAMVLLVTVAFVPSVVGQEKKASENDSSQFIAKHDLTKYAADAAKWEQEVTKLAANNSKDGGEDFILC